MRPRSVHPHGREIEHVYLTYDGGTPLVHLSKRFDSDKDSDIVASMFTAFQNFMDESFRSMGIGTVRSIELGDRHQLAFGRGRKVLLYVLYRGRESNRLEDRVIRLVVDIEARFAPLLEDWNGDLDTIEPLRTYLERVWELPTVEEPASPTVPKTA